MNRVLAHEPLFVSQQELGRVRPGSARQIIVTVAFLVAHIPLGLAMYRYESVATIHAILSTAVGLFWITVSRRNIAERATLIAAYIVGAEVLWRMTGAAFLWEGAKYSVAVILIAALIKTRRPHLPAA